jgi:sec-independent protein translocase protein TatA
MFRNPTTDLIVVLVIVLLIFGPKRLPGLGKQLGQGIRDFKEGITGESKDEEDQSAERPALTQATAAPAPAATPERKSAEGAPAADRPSAEVGSEGRS